MTEQELLQLKSDIDKAKSAIAELKGQEKAIIGQLKEWECNTIEEAEAKLKEMQESISDLDVKIAKGIEELEKKYK